MYKSVNKYLMTVNQEFWFTFWFTVWFTANYLIISLL